MSVMDIVIFALYNMNVSYRATPVGTAKTIENFLLSGVLHFGYICK